MEDVFNVCYSEIKLSQKSIIVLKKHIDPRRARKYHLSPEELDDIGLCYWYGHIVPLDYKAAIRWYKASAKRKNAVAEHNLYICYSQGTGVKKDMRQAVKWLKKAAQHGHSMSQLELGDYYFKGKYTKINRFRAKMWYEKSEMNALLSTNGLTLFYLGLLYMGIDLECENRHYSVDRDKATLCFEKSVEDDFPLSYSFLYSIYREDANQEKIDILMEKVRASKFCSKVSKEYLEKRYAEFMEKQSSKEMWNKEQ